MQDVLNLFFAGSIVYICVVIASIVLLLVRRKALKKGFDLFFFYTVLLLVFVIFNPLLFKLSGYLHDSTSVFARVWIICPLWMIVAYAVSSLDIKNKFISGAIVIAAAAVLIYFGGSTRSLKMFNTPSNPYKIRSEAVEISDEILNLSGGEPASLLIFVPLTPEPERFVNGGTIYEGINQYTASISACPIGYTDEYWDSYLMADYMPNGVTTTADYMNSLIDQYEEMHGIEYVALPDEDIFISRLEYCGYELAGHAGDYYIFRAMN